MISFDASELNGLAADLLSSGATVVARATVAVGQAADETRDAARSLAPRLTGALADSIDVEGGGLERVVSAGVPYAGYVEYGTSDTAPQPYMGPAATVADRALVDAIEDIADDIL